MIASRRLFGPHSCLIALWVIVGCRTPSPTTPVAVVQAPGPGAAEYSTQPPAGESARGPFAQGVAVALMNAGYARGQALAGDPRLAELAGWVADSLGEPIATPAYPVIDLFAHHLGMPEPTPHLLLLVQPDAAALERELANELTTLLPKQHYTHFGVATRARDGAAIAVLALSFRELSLSPVPRVLPEGARLVLRGSLGAGLHDPQLVVTYPDGSVSRSEPQRGPALEFPLEPRAAGAYRVELLGDSQDGIKVVANFPLYVGVPPVREVSVSSTGASAALPPAQMAARLLALINADRARAKLAPIARDSRLDEVALQHSQDMQQHGFVAHTSPTTGTAVERLARAAVRTPLVLENIGRGYSADEIHRGLMESPGHRENVLNRDATHVGIGVVIAPEDDQKAYLVTEVFGRFAGALDRDRATSQLLDAITRARRTRGLSALPHDAALATLCERAARRFFEDTSLSKEQLVEQLNREAAATHPSYHQLLGAAVLISSVEDASELDLWLDENARALALGFAQGTRPDTFERAILLLALVGY